MIKYSGFIYTTLAGGGYADARSPDCASRGVDHLVAFWAARGCGLRVVVLHNATLHDNGPLHLIFGQGIEDAI
jgi:hypothetical protein